MATSKTKAAKAAAAAKAKADAAKAAKAKIQPTTPGTDAPAPAPEAPAAEDPAPAAEAPVIDTPAAETPAGETPASEPLDEEQVDFELTQKDIEENPELAASGLKAGDTVSIPASALLSMDHTVVKRQIDMLPYLRNYPGEKKFYISTDGQVFLAAYHQEAKAHQAFIDAERKLDVYEV